MEYMVDQLVSSEHPNELSNHLFFVSNFHLCLNCMESEMLGSFHHMSGTTISVFLFFSHLNNNGQRIL